MDPFSQKKTKNIKETANILEVETDEKHSKTRTVIYYLHSDGQDDQIKRLRQRERERGTKKVTTYVSSRRVISISKLSLNRIIPISPIQSLHQKEAVRTMGIPTHSQSS